MDFQTIVDGICKAACVISVEKAENDGYVKICVVTGNRAYIDTIEKPVGMEMMTNKFIPDREYTNYVPKDLNFEEACYEAAVKKKCVNSYARPARYDVWFNMSFIPLSQDKGNICYCLYIVEVNLKPMPKGCPQFRRI